jgi:hypothetical protein
MRAKSGMSIANIDFNGSSVQAVDLVSTPSGARTADRTNVSDIALGIGLAAFVPALFWTGLVWAVCLGFGIPISGVALATLGFAVASFLTIVCSAMFRAG